MSADQPRPAALKPGTSLSLSGGGFRATLFHLGGLIRLNELGWLPKLNCVAAVSGGAITAAWLGLKFKELSFDEHGVAPNFGDQIVKPLTALCGRTLDTRVVLRGLWGGFAHAGKELDRLLARHFFGNARLHELPASMPEIRILAISGQTGNRATITSTGVAEPELGLLRLPLMPVSSAVAASCALAPYFSPLVISAKPSDWEMKADRPSPSAPYITHLHLADGGAADNLALEVVWDEFTTLLISDASTPIPPWPVLPNLRLVGVMRNNRMLYDRSRQLHRRILLEYKFAAANPSQHGAYWALDSEIESFGLTDPVTVDDARTRALGRKRTRLGRFSRLERAALVNWGYALCDTAMRRHLMPNAPRPGKLPLPAR